MRHEREPSSGGVTSLHFSALLAVSLLLLLLAGSGAFAAPALRAEHIVSVHCRGGEYFDFTPLGLAFDASGKLYVVDADNSRVMVIKDPFEDMRPFSDFFTDSVGIHFVDVDVRDGLTVYVSEENRGLLIGFDRLGRPRAEVSVGEGVAGFGIGPGGKACVANPAYEVIRLVYIDGDRETADVTARQGEGHMPYLDCLVLGEGKFVASAAGRKRLLHFNAVGNYLGPFGSHDFTEPYGIASFADEYVLVSDVGEKEIIVLDLKGNRIGEFGKNHLDEPAFLAVRRDGTVCVSDTRRRTIEVFKIEIE